MKIIDSKALLHFRFRMQIKNSLFQKNAFNVSLTIVFELICYLIQTLAEDRQSRRSRIYYSQREPKRNLAPVDDTIFAVLIEQRPAKKIKEN